MKFPDSFLDEIRSRLSVSQVVSRRVPLKRAGREWKGLSPFNQEKTPSFTVNDQKGFYHCFSSGKHGDIFRFVMEMEGLSFPEAVEKLAQDAGLSLPKADPEAERASKRRLSLLDALEAAASLFETELGRREGKDALVYAERRGLSAATRAEFRIGFAPNGKDGLKAALGKRGFTEAQLLEAGLLVRPDDGRAPYDRFRNRLTIPITDIKGRVIAFGARALDEAQQPKYLNSPETSLFDKGSTIFNFARARGPAFDKGELIVVEGYMDVIALHQAGFGNAVATLGTAFTERQMERLWQLAPEPIICFDGDRAGEAAAARAIDRMLPILREGHSFRFAFLPQGSDPDDLVRNEGASAFSACIGNALPLIDVLWQREQALLPLDTPERRAAFEERLEQRLASIGNARVRDHYRREVKNRLFALWRGGGGRGPRGTPRSALRPLVAKANTAPPSTNGFATTVVLILMSHPWLLDRFADEVAGLEIRQKALAGLLGAITHIVLDRPGIARAALYEELAAGPHGPLVARLNRISAYKRLGFLAPETEPAIVEQHFVDLLFRCRALPSLKKELDDFADQLTEMTEPEFEQFVLLQQQVANAGSRHMSDDVGEHEHVRRLQETVARVRAENIGGRRGRRPA